MAKPEPYYRARVTIERVQPAYKEIDRYGNVTLNVDRDQATVTEFNLAGKKLDGVKNRTIAHVELVSDFDFAGDQE